MRCVPICSESYKTLRLAFQDLSNFLVASAFRPTEQENLCLDSYLGRNDGLVDSGSGIGPVDEIILHFLLTECRLRC